MQALASRSMRTDLNEGDAWQPELADIENASGNAAHRSIVLINP